VTGRTLALILTLAAALLATAAPAHARALQVGIAADGLLLNGSEREAEKAIEEWRELGIDTVRIQVQWSRVAPSPRSYDPPEGFNPGDPTSGYQWGDYDRAVRLLTEHGIRPLLMLGGPPPLWASSRPRAGNPRYMPSAYHFGQFAAAVAHRYADRVEEYILWNEPNLPLWLQPQATCKGPRKKQRCTPVSPHTYRFMVRAAYPAIKTIDPSSKVLVGALAPAGANLKSKNANMRPLQWLRAFGCVDALLQPVRTGPCRSFQPAPADGFAYHPHSTKHPPHEGYPNPDDAALASLSKVKKLLDHLQNARRLDGTTKPLGLWLDEYAYQTNPPDKLRGVTNGRQDRYLQQAAYQAWRDPRVQLIAQYLWEDEKVGGGKRYTGWQSGLRTSDGDAKPALAHFDAPFWIDYARSTIWGQVRPGAEHEVEIQVRPAGPGTAWQPVARMQTAADGSYFLRTKLQPFAAYRAVYGDGDTTGSQVASPLEEAEGGGPGKEVSGGLPVERRTVAPLGGQPVPPSFAGLSIEWRSVPDYIGSGGAVNPIFQRLVSTLEKAGTGAPTLRFGGDSTDHTWFNPTGAPKPAQIVTDVDDPWIRHLRQWTVTARTPLVLGLNMGLNDPGQAAALGGALRGLLPPGAISAFELGNEPDLYDTPRAYAVGRNVLRRELKRQPEYGFADYRKEVAEHVQAIRSAAPEVPLSGGGFASAGWDEVQDDVLGAHQDVRSWSAHHYPLQTCDHDLRKKGGAAYIPKILASNAYKPIVDRMRHLVAVAASHGAALRVTEINSAICGGLRGMSDTMAAALWGTDVLFGLAEAGVANVDFHTWTGSRYGAVEFQRAADGRLLGRVRPLFYSLLLFNRATPDGSRMLPVGPNPATAKLKTWGTIDQAGTRRFVVINKDVEVGRKLVLTAGQGARRATVSRLSAPALRSQNNVTFAGRGWGGSTTDGRLQGKRRVEKLVARNGAFRLVMPPGTAALVEVPASGRKRRR
jgi:hypothetical protein